MKKVRFIKKHGKHEIGHVIGTSDSAADSLVSDNIAIHVGDHVRPLKYKAGNAVQTECVAPTVDEIESSPKGVSMPTETKDAFKPLQTVKATKKNKKTKF